MAAAGRWKFYDRAKLHSTDGTFALPGQTYNVALFLSTGNANTLSGSEKFADLTNEVASANGYTSGGKTVTSPTWTNASGVETFTAGAVSWNATGSGITARSAVLYIVGTVNGIVNPLICTCLLDATPQDVTVTAGNTLTITMNASGTFQLSGATTD